ncbi:MAG: hypothetical protein IT537_30530 [Hyphomicrobiales bacterium]|nr:hypothetical protein [Hyphomicrobiales bacterium]
MQPRSYDQLVDEAVQHLLLSMREGAAEADAAHVDAASAAMLAALEVLAGGAAAEYWRADVEQVHRDTLARLGARLRVAVEDGADAATMIDVLRQAARVS